MMSSGQIKKVLVIEDESHIHRLIRLVLENKGYRVDVATCGEDGVKYLEDAGDDLPDLILLDIIMPGAGGMAVLSTIKSLEKTKEIPVVMLTALAQENVVLQGIKLGAKDYIRKPFHPNELVERVSKLIA
jgi:DNA-binding response OmpR family regulator